MPERLRRAWRCGFEAFWDGVARSALGLLIAILAVAWAIHLWRTR